MASQRPKYLKESMKFISRVGGGGGGLRKSLMGVGMDVFLNYP